MEKEGLIPILEDIFKKQGKSGGTPMTLVFVLALSMLANTYFFVFMYKYSKYACNFTWLSALEK